MSNQKTQSFMANGRVQVYRHPTAGLLASVADIIRTIGVTEKDGLRGLIVDFNGFFNGSVHNVTIDGKVRRFIAMEKVPTWLAAYFPGNQLAAGLLDSFMEDEELTNLLTERS